MNQNHSQYFYLPIGGKKELKKEFEQLCKYFGLLDSTEIKSMEKYLDSPFFDTNPKLKKLFSNLYKKYINGTRHIKPKIFLRQFFNREDFKRDSQRLKQLIKQLCKLILSFKSHSFLKHHPQENYRLAAESLRNSGNSEIFQFIITNWEKTIKQLDAGSEKTLHHWWMHHLNYMSTDLKKDQQNVPELLLTAKSLDHLYNLHNLLYQNEIESRVNTYRDHLKKEEIDNNYISVHPLISIYTLIIELRQQKDFNSETYEYLKNLILQEDHQISKDHLIICYQLMVNYINRFYQIGEGDMEKEHLFWLKYQLDNNLLTYDGNAIAKSHFLNCLNISLINKDVKLARHIINELGPYVKPIERESAYAHGEIAITFFKKDYRQVLILLEEGFPKFTMDTYIDSIRLKSYKLRSLLSLAARHEECPDILKNEEKEEDEDCYDLFQKAKKDYEKYLERQKKNLSKQQHIFFNNFLKIIQKIFLGLQNLDLHKKHQNLLIQIENRTIPLHGRDWLLQFLNAYKK